MLHNDDVVLPGGGENEIRLWDKIGLAQFYRPHLLLTPRAAGDPSLYYVVDATDYYLTLVAIDMAHFALDVTFATLREFVPTKAIDEYWVVDYSLAVAFSETESPTILVGPETDVSSLPRFIAINYAHLLTKEQLHTLILEMPESEGRSLPKSASKLLLITRLLDLADVQGDARANMLRLAEGQQKRRPKKKEPPPEKQMPFPLPPVPINPMRLGSNLFR